MKRIGFIGAYDKIDLILNVAKILVTMRKKVLVIDSTNKQKARYIVPAINPAISYITTFEDIDVAVGFNNLQEIKRYIGIEDESNLPYDIVLIDADINERIEEFDLHTAQKNYFVTSFDLYSLKKGMEILNSLIIPINLEKVLFSQNMLKEEDDYLNYLALGYKITWEDNRIYFPIDNGDLTVLIENQRVEKIKLKKLSMQYKDGLTCMVCEILQENNDLNVRRAIKIIEKGV